MFNAKAAAMHTDRHTVACDICPPMPSVMRHDTRAWKLQVWISFATAATLCGTGLAWLPGQDLDRAFMVMGYLFTLSSVFVVSKYVRDHQQRRSDTPLWGVVVWAGFGAAMVLTAWGLWRMEINPTYKAFLGVSWLFLVSSVFTLAKTLRDTHDALLAEAAQKPTLSDGTGEQA